VTEKLGRDNFPLWKAQVMPPLRALQLVGFLDGTAEVPSKTITVEMENKKGEKCPQVVPNEAYTAWVSQNQQVLGFLLSSLSREVLTQVASLTTAA
jgi:histone deacetylase 1/2